MEHNRYSEVDGCLTGQKISPPLMVLGNPLHGFCRESLLSVRPFTHTFSLKVIHTVYYTCFIYRNKILQVAKKSI